jgi:virulence factor MgtC-like protein
MATSTPNAVEVHAHVLATAPSDTVLEQIVGRLSHERDVSEVSWMVGWDHGSQDPEPPSRAWDTTPVQAADTMGLE